MSSLHAAAHLREAAKSDKRSSVVIEQDRVRRKFEDSTSDQEAANVVKLVAEGIYRALKEDFDSTTDKQTLNKMKKSLLRATESVLDNVMTEYHITNKVDTSQEPQITNAPATQTFPSSNTAILPKLRVSFQYRRPNQALRIAITGSRDNISRGMLVDGEYTSYEIRTCRIVSQAKVTGSLSQKQQTPSKQGLNSGYRSYHYQIERRHSEIQKLFTQLSKLHPFTLIPSPSYRSSWLDGKEFIVDFRKRNHRLYLEYLGNCPKVFNSMEFITFLTGLSPSDVTRMSTVNNTNWPDGNDTGTHYSDMIAEAEDILLFCHTSPIPPAGAGNRSSLRLYQDLQLVQRDTKRLKSDGEAVIDTARKLINTMSNLLLSNAELVSALAVSDTTSHSRFFDPLSKALHSIEQPQQTKSKALLIELMEPVSLFYASFLPAALELSDKVSKMFNIAVTKSPQPPITSQKSSGGKSRKSEAKMIDDSLLFDDDQEVNNNGNNNEEEAHQAAVDFVQSVDYAGRFRGRIILKQLTAWTQTMIEESHQEQCIWKAVRRELELVTVPAIPQHYQQQQPRRNQVQQPPQPPPPTTRKSEANITQEDASTSAAESQDNSQEQRFPRSNTNPWNFVSAFLQRPAIPAGTRKPPSVRFAADVSDTANNAVSAGDKSRRSTFAETDEQQYQRESSVSPPPPSPRYQKATAPAAAAEPLSIKPVQAAASRKAHHYTHRSTISHSTNTTTANDDFFIRAPAPAASISGTTGQVASHAEDLPTTPSPIVPPQQQPPPVHKRPNAPVGERASESSVPVPMNRNRTSSATDSATAASSAASSFTKAATMFGGNGDSPAKTSRKTVAQQPAQQQQQQQEAEPTAAATASSTIALPEGWQQAVTAEGRVYYYNAITRVSRWTPPSEDVAASVAERIEKANNKVEEAVHKRKQEMEEQRLQAEATANVVSALKPSIKKAIEMWKRPKGSPRPRDISELLSNLHCIILSIPEGAITSDQLTNKSPASDIKRAYLKAARFIHPDKLTADMVVEEKLVAEEVFIALTDAYNDYKKANNIV